MEIQPIPAPALAPTENPARKNPVEIQPEQSSEPQPVKQGPGRPRKHPKPDPAAPKRPPGRPRKHPILSEPLPKIDLAAFVEEHRDHVVEPVEHAAAADALQPEQPQPDKRERDRLRKRDNKRRRNMPAPKRSGPGRPSAEELSAAWAAPTIERNPDGTIKKGQVLNAGGLTAGQARIKNMLEGATVPMIARLLELAQSQDEHIALGAVRAWLDKVAVTPKTNVAVAVQVKAGEGHMTALRAIAERRAAAGLDAHALPVPAAPEVNVSFATEDGVTHISTGPGHDEPEVIDVEAVEVE